MWTRYKVKSRSGGATWEYVWIHSDNAEFFREHEDEYIECCVPHHEYWFRGDQTYDRGIEIEIDVVPPREVVEEDLKQEVEALRRRQRVLEAKEAYLAQMPKEEVEPS